MPSDRGDGPHHGSLHPSSLPRSRRRGAGGAGSALARRRAPGRGHCRADPRLGTPARESRRRRAAGGRPEPRGRRRGRPANGGPHRPRPQPAPHLWLARAGRRASGRGAGRHAPAPVPPGVRDRRVLSRRRRVHAMPRSRHPARGPAQLPGLALGIGCLRRGPRPVAAPARRAGGRLRRAEPVRSRTLACPGSSRRRGVRRPPCDPCLRRHAPGAWRRSSARRLPAGPREGRRPGDRGLPDRRRRAGDRR